MQNLSADVMWQATIACDGTYDGLFYYAVRTTGIFCRPSCKSRIPNRCNVEFFASREQALEKGYRPCKRCRPDLAPESPDCGAAAVNAAKSLLEAEYRTQVTLDQLANRVGVSAFHFHRLFRERLGMTPKQYLEKIRIDKAKELLAHSDLNNTDIGYAVGFSSLSSFYSAFRKRTGCSPKQYRTICRNGGQEESSREINN